MRPVAWPRGCIRRKLRWRKQLGFLGLGFPFSFFLFSYSQLHLHLQTFRKEKGGVESESLMLDVWGRHPSTRVTASHK